MKDTITAVRGLEIHDSRSNPIVPVFVELRDGTKVSASVPSGARIGENEAVELRDGDNARYLEKGVLKAVNNGGAHAENSVDIQEFMAVPVGAPHRLAKDYGML